MAKDTKKAEAKDAKGESSRGRAIILPNGEKRADYCRKQYEKYEAQKKAGKFEGSTRGQVVKDLAEMGHEVPYQVVLQATKAKKDENGKGTKGKGTEKAA